MDDNTSTNTSTNTPSTSSQDQISSLLFAAAARETQTQQQQMHMHSLSSSSSSYFHHYPLERGSGGEDSGAGTGSEEGLDVPEEPARPAPHRSGSKRSRAAEVHNLSEKRRRSKINEKMKALQNLIPNSNKTDKASMLDEAIEYLKQLQLQVQMLSMRNGLNSHQMYLPGTLHPLQASQLCMSFGANASAINLGVLGMLPLNQDSSANNSFDLTSQCTTSHQTVMLPTASISAPETSFALEPLQSHHTSFQLGVPSEEIFTQDMVSQRQLDSGRTTGNLSETVMKTMVVTTSLHFGGQASTSLEHNDHLENVISKDNPENNPIFDQNFDGLQTGRSVTKDDVKAEALGL